jgi:DNA-binding transcriptional regulator of glucitol operon
MIGRYRAAYSELVLRLVFSPRWIMWHVLTIGAVITCGLLAAWQWGKAGTAMGSALNIGYGLQWPLFAVFFAVMWFRMLRLEIRAMNGEQAEVAEAPTLTRPLSQPAPASTAEAAEAEPSEPSPFTPRPAAVEPITDETDPELAAYNRMLAALAQRDEAFEAARETKNRTR